MPNRYQTVVGCRGKRDSERRKKNKEWLVFVVSEARMGDVLRHSSGRKHPEKREREKARELAEVPAR